MSNPAPGLCGDCRNARSIVSDRGSRFVLCELSRTDRTFPRYPRLPILSCSGHVVNGAGRVKDPNAIERPG